MDAQLIVVIAGIVLVAAIIGSLIFLRGYSGKFTFDTQHGTRPRASEGEGNTSGTAFKGRFTLLTVGVGAMFAALLTKLWSMQMVSSDYYEDLSVLNVTAWQHWVAVSEVDYCDGLLYIDLEKQSFQCTKRYYAAGNFSKYIPHGAVRVAVHTGDPALKALAFVQGEDTVVLLINDMPAEKAVSFAGLGTAAQLVVTDAHVNLQQRWVDPAAVTLPAKSVSTLLFSGTA